MAEYSVFVAGHLISPQRSRVARGVVAAGGDDVGTGTGTSTAPGDAVDDEGEVTEVFTGEGTGECTSAAPGDDVLGVGDGT